MRKKKTSKILETVLMGMKTFPRWDEYFDEVFDDDEIGNAFTASDDDPTYHGWEFEPVSQPTQTPYPGFDSVNFPQENRISGIRALKAPLAVLFGTRSDEEH
ncbi:hypothetical protein GQ600_23686 [Phytophthora cactorum]|nr:hypothetical protein GQ600_23686 [Phytophthora cactorum]